VDGYGNWPLWIAVDLQNLALCRLLLEHRNADGQSALGINRIHDWAGLAPLHHAVRHNCPRVCSLLLAHGADVNLPDAYRRPPLWHAARLNQRALCDALLDSGAVGTQRVLPNGSTPISIAARYEHYSLHEHLLQRAVAQPARDEGYVRGRRMAVRQHPLCHFFSR
jgi:ankyrin repeat protein